MKVERDKANYLAKVHKEVNLMSKAILHSGLSKFTFVEYKTSYKRGLHLIQIVLHVKIPNKNKKTIIICSDYTISRSSKAFFLKTILEIKRKIKAYKDIKCI